MDQRHFFLSRAVTAPRSLEDPNEELHLVNAEPVIPEDSLRSRPRLPHHPAESRGLDWELRSVPGTYCAHGNKNRLLSAVSCVGLSGLLQCEWRADRGSMSHGSHYASPPGLRSRSLGLDERWLPTAYPDNLFASKTLRGWHVLALADNLSACKTLRGWHVLALGNVERNRLGRSQPLIMSMAMKSLQRPRRSKCSGDLFDR